MGKNEAPKKFLHIAKYLLPKNMLMMPILLGKTYIVEKTATYIKSLKIYYQAITQQSEKNFPNNK